MKIEKIEKEIAKLEREISVLNSNRTKNVNPTTLREIDAKIHAKQKSIDAKKVLIAHLKKEQKVNLQPEEKLTFEIEEVAQEQKIEATKEASQSKEVENTPKEVEFKIPTEEEILASEIAGLEMEIEKLKLNKMRIRRESTINEINEKIQQKDKLLASKKAKLSMLKIGKKVKAKEEENTL